MKALDFIQIFASNVRRLDFRLSSAQMCIRDSFAAWAALAAASLSAGVLWAMETPETLNPKTAHNAKIKCLFIILVTVSYTHLDVYKRQPQREPRHSEVPGL